jgi:hypothetical protein
VQQQDDEAAEEQQQQQQRSKANGKQPREFYVKWKDRSYLHCSWVAEDIVNRACAVRVVGQANPVVARLRKFWRDQASAAASGELAEAEEAGELVHGLNPAWVQVRGGAGGLHAADAAEGAVQQQHTAWQGRSTCVCCLICSSVWVPPLPDCNHD